MMKVTSKFLHIPPYLSTNWVHVRTLHLDAKTKCLIVSLMDNTIVEIPELNQEAIDTIFLGYASFLDSNLLTPSPVLQGESFLPVHSLMRLDMTKAVNFSSATQHDQAQSDMPDIPEEILNKITQIARIVAPEELQNMSPPEPYCNCPHCQVLRAIHGNKRMIDHHEPKEIVDIDKEPVSDQDLSFQLWEITEVGTKLYEVSKKENVLEKYTVFLGDPIGCTCGKAGMRAYCGCFK